MASSIKYLIVIPKSPKYGVFYINGNIEDGHMKEYEALYLFIAQMLRPPATIQVHELIFTHEPFYVDIDNNYVEHLRFDSAAKILELKKNVIKGLNQKAIKEMRRLEKKEIDASPANTLQRLLDKVTASTLLSDRSFSVYKGKDKKSDIMRREGKDYGPKIIK